MDFNTLISFIGATIGAGFFLLYGYAFQIAGSSIIYSIIIAFLVFLVSAIVFLRIFFKEGKRNLSFLEKRIKFPYQWIILFAEASWLSLCVLAVGYIGNHFLGFSVMNMAIFALFLIILVNFLKKAISLERLMVTLIILSSFLVLLYYIPTPELIVPEFSYAIFPTIPLLFILFVGFERLIFLIPFSGKKEMQRGTLSTIFIAFIFYIVMLFVFPNPQPNVYFISDYFPYPFNIFIIIPVTMIFLASANSSIEISVDMIKELAKKKNLPEFFNTRKEYSEVLLIFVAFIVLILNKGLLIMAYLTNIAYICFFLLVSLYAFLEKDFDKKLPLLSILLLSITLFFIPSDVILLFVLILPLMIFSGDIIKALV